MASSQASTGSGHVPPLSVHLNIRTPGEKEQFLKEIHPLFLEIVDPWESGLLDRMTAEGLMTDLDRESMSGKDVRTPRDLRRKVWLHLTKLTEDELRTKVFPTLYQEFPHIIPSKFLTQTAGSLMAGEEVHNKECFRHSVMRRTRVDSVVDKMYQHGFISLESYSWICKKGCTADQLWAMLFDMCALQAPKVTSMMKDVLEMHRIPVPANLGWIVSCGFPCTCVQGPAFLPDTPPSSHRRVASWIEKLPSWLSSRLPGSIRSTKSSDLYSISEKNPAWQSESVVNTNSMVSSAAAAAFLPQGGCPEKSATFDLHRGRGEVDGMSGFALPQISVTGFPNPPFTVESLNTLNPNSVEIQMPDLTHTIPQRMEMMTIQNEATSGNGRSYVENSANQSMRAEDGCPFTGVSILGSWKVWKLLLFPGIPLMVFVLVLSLALNVVQIFQLYKGSSNPGDQVVNAFKILWNQQEAQLIKNFTSVIDLHMKQHMGMDDAYNASKS